MKTKKINPNSDKSYIDNVNLESEHNFPKFLKEIDLEVFRHIRKLSISFKHPISVISGTNRSGKSTVLMALACSHFDFKKRNVQNGKLERHTRSSIMQFTNQDKQSEDRTYYITYKIGNKIIKKRGQRKCNTKKRNGIGKKESQFTSRDVVFIDLDRVLPARNFGKTIFNKTKKAILSNISNDKTKIIEEYISYILEEEFTLKKITDHLDKNIINDPAAERTGYSVQTSRTVWLLE